MPNRSRLSNSSRVPLPIPTLIEGTDEFPKLPQTEKQRKAEKAILEIAGQYSAKLGMDRREFLKTACGMAAAFMAMNSVYGSLFRVSTAEAANPDAAAERKKKFAGQFIFDVQTHFVSDNDYEWKGLLQLRKAAQKWNPELKGEELTVEKIQYDTFVKEIFQQSDTTLALLSSAPSDVPDGWFIRNDEIARTKEKFNKQAGYKRLFSHAVIVPGQPGWLEKIDKAISEYKPDSWKGYTVGSPSTFSKYPWRLDDEKLLYPAYEKIQKAGILNVCIHKGLISPGLKKNPDSTWRYGNVEDVSKAAKDWPGLNFIIYHSAIEKLGEPSSSDIKTFEETGYVPWVSDLARIRGEKGISNVYAELGTVFGSTAISNPRYCAGILGQLIKGLGADRVLWGTDAIWYGSPQWQIEAFRRIEIPEDLRRKFRYEPLGSADSSVKNKIFGQNAARLYNLDIDNCTSPSGA